ncbi:MAG: SIR2 family protein [Solirubrobacteraceae bacterium]
MLDELVARSWQFHDGWLKEFDSALVWRLDRQPILQLELVLELLGQNVDPRILVGIFTLLSGAHPTRAHFLLATYPGDVVTTNQDLLIEAAARQQGVRSDVLHLHGDWRHPGSVVALISQYVVGLKRRIRDRLLEIVRGREVLVLGYSGRDRDVMPYLAEAGHVRWRHYVDGRACSQPLSAELLNLMRARPGLVTVEETSTPLAPLEGLNTTGHSSTSSYTPKLSVRARRAFDALDPRAIDLALIQVLDRAGAQDLAERSLRTLAQDPGRVQASVQQAMGNMLASRDRAAAERYYRCAAALAAGSEQIAAAELGIANVASNQSDYAGAETALQRALEAADRMRGRHRDRVLGRILAQRARMHAMTDQEGRSMREYRRVFMAARRSGDLDTLVRALTFGSDPWRSRGRYAEAMAMLDQARSDVELYAQPNLAGWMAFYRGNCLGAMHRLDEAHMELARSRKLARIAGEPSLEAWAWIMTCNFHRADDLRMAANHLRSGRRCIARLGSNLFALQARVTFEEAELLRARRRWSACETAANGLADAIGDRHGQQMPYLEAHLAALRAEIARECGREDANRLVAVAHRAYRDGHWAHGVARMELSRWLLDGGTPPPRFVERCKRLNYGFELEQLAEAPRTGYVPLLVI